MWATDIMYAINFSSIVRWRELSVTVIRFESQPRQQNPDYASGGATTTAMARLRQQGCDPTTWWRKPDDTISQPDDLIAQTRQPMARPMDRRIPSGAANSKIDRKIHGGFEIDRQILKWIVWFKERRMDWQMDFTEKHGKVESRLGFAYYDAYFQHWVLYGVMY